MGFSKKKANKKSPETWNTFRQGSEIFTTIIMDSSLGYAGVGLNVPERTKLEILMAKTQAEEKLSEINFWGKIYGTEADYLICCAMKKAFTSTPVKTFYVW